METEQVAQDSKKPIGKIVTITLALALTVALGFIVWQNFIYDTPQVETNTTSTTNPSDAASKGDTPVSDPVLPDLIEYPDGVKIANQADLAKLTNAPATFGAYLYGTIEQARVAAQVDGCSIAVTVHKIYKQSYASGAVQVTGEGGSCGGGFKNLWGDNGGSWKSLTGTQSSAFGCADLVKYKVPSKVAGTTCIDEANPDGRSYTQE